jgi:hypothetical protein
VWDGLKIRPTQAGRIENPSYRDLSICLAEAKERKEPSVGFLDSYFWYFIVAGAVIVVTLIGLLLFLRNQGED